MASCAIQGVARASEEHFRFDLAEIFRTFDGKASGGRRIFEHLAIQRDLVMSHDWGYFGDIEMLFFSLSLSLVASLAASGLCSSDADGSAGLVVSGGLFSVLVACVLKLLLIGLIVG